MYQTSTPTVTQMAQSNTDTNGDTDVHFDSGEAGIWCFFFGFQRMYAWAEDLDLCSNERRGLLDTDLKRTHQGESVVGDW